jgi:hypothetical protein
MRRSDNYEQVTITFNSKLHVVSGAQGREGQFVEVGQVFHGIPAGSRVFLGLRCIVLEKVLRDVASWCWPHLATKPSHVGFDADGLTYPLHRPMACSHQTRGHGFMSSAALSRCAVDGDGAFSGGAKPPGLDIC